jgi:hypothetical protein
MIFELVDGGFSIAQIAIHYFSGYNTARNKFSPVNINFAAA